MTDRPEDKDHPWGEPVVKINLHRSPSGLMSLESTSHANLAVTGRSLEEVFSVFVTFAEDCEKLGQPFRVLSGIKLR